MFDISWSEMWIVAVAALIFLGPKDLPVLMRTIGRYWGWERRQIDMFRSELDTVVREADLDLVRKELRRCSAERHKTNCEERAVSLRAVADLDTDRHRHQAPAL